MTTARRNHTATLLPNGTVLIAGGQGPDAGILASAELYHALVPVPALVLFSLSARARRDLPRRDRTSHIGQQSCHRRRKLSMYTTSLVDGCVIPPRVAVGGRLAHILSFGASSYPGYFQVNFRVPNGGAPGPDVLVRLSYLGRPSNDVTIALQ